MFDDCDLGQIPFRQTIVVVAIETGMRRGEMLGLVLLDWVADDRSPRKNTPR
jgi:integrase